MEAKGDIEKKSGRQTQLKSDKKEDVDAKAESSEEKVEEEKK
jgi:hypothetical protein